MGKAKTLTEQWKARLAEKRKERAASVVSVPVCFAGFEGRAHRLNLMEWARGGRLPQYLSTAFFEAMQGKSVEKKQEDLTPEELASWLRFQCEAFCSMFDEPKFTTGIDTTGETLFYPEFVAEFPEVINEAVQWQLKGCPDIPVQMIDGSEASITEVKKFRRRKRRAAASQSSFNQSGVWWDTKPTIRHI